MARGDHTYDGKYIQITYNLNMSGTITIKRKSSGEEFEFFAPDIFRFLAHLKLARAVKRLEKTSNRRWMGREKDIIDQ